MRGSSVVSRTWIRIGFIAILALVTSDRLCLGQTKSVTQDSRIGSWPQFLGPHRNGISDEKNLLETWPPNGPTEVWRSAAGIGMSGLSIQAGTLMTMYQDAQHQYVAAFNAAKGKSLWETPVATAYKNQMGNGPRATPTITEDSVFAYTGEGVLCALKRSTGELMWSNDIVKDLGVKPADYGMACSPLVVGEQVIVLGGARRGTVVACDAKTGRQLWKAGSDATGYSSPSLLNIGGQPQIVAFTGSSVLGLSPQSGSILWRHDYVTDYDCNIAAPLLVQGKVFVSSGENHGCVLLEPLKVDGGYQVKEVWASQGVRSVMRNEWQTSILWDGYLYGLDNVGSAGAITHLNCVKADTGERIWQQPRFGKSNLIAADGKLFFSTMRGELVVVRATPRGYEELGRSKVLETTRQAPALAGGLLYLRDNREIVCLDVRAPQ